MRILLLVMVGITCLLRPIRAGGDLDLFMTPEAQQKFLLDVYLLCLERWFDEPDKHAPDQADDDFTPQKLGSSDRAWEVFEEMECYKGVELKADNKWVSVAESNRVLKRPESKEELQKKSQNPRKEVGRRKNTGKPSAFAMADLERKLSSSWQAGRTTIGETVNQVSKTPVKIPQHFGYQGGFTAPWSRGGGVRAPLLRTIV
ncbi:MAG: hypothetical protein M1823_000868 [Watsoniomyces obsoletus]|nr:MAG: hypothetical protein M1823_000868 [Watsoniomyces obsoletus]